MAGLTGYGQSRHISAFSLDLASRTHERLPVFHSGSDVQYLKRSCNKKIDKFNNMFI